MVASTLTAPYGRGSIGRHWGLISHSPTIFAPTVYELGLFGRFPRIEIPCQPADDIGDISIWVAQYILKHAVDSGVPRKGRLLPLDTTDDRRMQAHSGQLQPLVPPQFSHL
jgi:hypothetical protein